MSKGADMATLVIEHIPNGDRFHYTFINNSKMGFPISTFTKSGVPLTREDMIAVFAKMLEDCMPKET